MILWIGSGLYWVGFVLDFIFSMKAKDQGIPEWIPPLRGKNGLFAPMRNIIATASIFGVAIILALNIEHDGMGWILGALGVARLVGAGFNISKTQ